MNKKVIQVIFYDDKEAHRKALAMIKQAQDLYGLSETAAVILLLSKLEGAEVK